MKFIRVIIGCVFLLSAVMKLSDFQNTVLFFSNIVSILNTWIRGGLSMLILIELIFSIAVLQTKIDILVIYNLMIILLIMFSGIGMMFLFLKIENCGCFGTIFQTNPILTIAKNVILIGLILFLKKRENRIYDG